MGQKLAACDSNGNITAFYDTTDSPVPPGIDTVSITDAQWQACISTPGYTVQNGQLVTPAPPTAAQLLAQTQQSQVTLIAVACAKAIVSGYTSSALGSAYTYGSQSTDQANLLSLAQAAQGGALWCANSSGTWGFVAHTATQVNQVLADWVKYRQAQQSKYATLVSQVNMATTLSAVQAVAWS